jgi:hypothetical protein
VNPEECWSQYDLVALLTPHRCFDVSSILKKCRLLLDAKNATRDLREDEEKIIRL